MCDPADSVKRHTFPLQLKNGKKGHWFTLLCCFCITEANHTRCRPQSLHFPVVCPHYKPTYRNTLCQKAYVRDINGQVIMFIQMWYFHCYTHICKNSLLWQIFSHLQQTFPAWIVIPSLVNGPLKSTLYFPHLELDLYGTLYLGMSNKFELSKQLHQELQAANSDHSVKSYAGGRHTHKTWQTFWNNPWQDKIWELLEDT